MEKDVRQLVNRFLPAQMRIEGVDGRLARIDLRDANISYDPGSESGVERMEVGQVPGAATSRTVIYGLERIPGRMPADLRINEYRASECVLRWADHGELTIKVNGRGGALKKLYRMMVYGITIEEQ